MTRERREGRRGWLALAAALACGFAQTSPGDEDKDDGSFGMTTPVACKEIRGFEDYDVLPGAALTADEKLLVYYRPRHFKTARVGGKFEAHFTQDGRIRRRGQKAVLWSKPKLLDYRQKGDTPSLPISLRNTIALKGLKPGDYELDIVLHDEVGRSAPAVRSLPFKVVPAAGVEESGKGEPRRGGSR